MEALAASTARRAPGRPAEARGQGPDAVRSRSDAAGALDGESGPITLPGTPGKTAPRKAAPPRREARPRAQLGGYHDDTSHTAWEDSRDDVALDPCVRIGDAIVHLHDAYAALNPEARRRGANHSTTSHLQTKR